MTRMLTTLSIAFAAIISLADPAPAITPEEKGLAIAREADRRDLGFGDSRAALEMILTNRRGDQSRRELRILTLENPDESAGDSGLVVFDRPRDVKGTALLTFSNILEPDDQWIYLPAVARVKRISSRNKSGPFMGSEFAYEDMGSQEVGKYTHRHLRDEACGELVCYVIERVPLYPHSGYRKQIVWIDQDEYRMQKIEFYDRKDALLKTLVFGDYRQYLEQYWRAHDLFMVNHQTGKSTRLTWSEFTFRSGLGKDDFTRAALKRLR